MFRNRWFLSAVLALTVALGIVSASLMTRTTAAPAPSDTTPPGFRGKVLLVRSNFGMEVIVLEEVKVRQFGEHAFLLGKVVESRGGRGSLKGKTVWQNLNGVTQIIECDNAEEAKKTLKTIQAEGIGGYGVPVPVTPAVPGTVIPDAPLAPPKQKQ
ncbi:MAG TPA: hypothetical protein VH643_20200 [Gemmataceae bacterium]|jgi:hypothetical protein